MSEVMKRSYLHSHYGYFFIKLILSCFILLTLTNCAYTTSEKNTVESAYESSNTIQMQPYNRSIISSINF